MLKAIFGLRMPVRVPGARGKYPGRKAGPPEIARASWAPHYEHNWNAQCLRGNEKEEAEGEDGEDELGGEHGDEEGKGEGDDRRAAI